MKLYGEELRKSILDSIARTQEVMADRAARIAAWETDEDDCFLSARVDANSLNEYKAQLDILDNGGVYDWDCYFDKDGKEVSVRWVNTRYGAKVVANGVFANSIKALLKKTGLVEKTVKVPVWTKFAAGCGRGMEAVYSGSYQVVRWHTNMATGEYVGYPD